MRCFLFALLLFSASLLNWTPTQAQQSSGSPYDITQRAQLEEYSLLKFTVNDLRVYYRDLNWDPRINYDFQLGYERKIDTSWSIQTGISLGGESTETTYSRNYGLELGSRYYYRLKRHVRSGKQVNNLFGYYLSGSANWTHTRFKSTDYRIVGLQKKNVVSFNLRWGRQFHLDQHWVLDLNVGLSKKVYRTDDFLTSLTLRSLVPNYNFGFGYRI